MQKYARTNSSPQVRRGRAASLGDVLAPTRLSCGSPLSSPSPSSRKLGRKTDRSMSICHALPGSLAASPALPRHGGKNSRKNSVASVASLGDHFSSLISISSQVALNIGEKVGPKRNSISADELADILLRKVKKSLKEKKAEEMPVPDWAMMGMTLTAGRLIGLGNITREDLPAALDERPDKVYLTFTYEWTDLVSTYTWCRKKIRGQLKIHIDRVLVRVKLRQDMTRDSSTAVVEFSVGALENILIDMQGMGFFNGMMNKVVTSMVQQNVHTVLMASGKDFMKKEFVDCSLLDHMYTSFKIL